MNPDRFQKIAELYHLVEDLTPEERAKMLEESDPDLRREVESLLNQNGEKSPLDRPVLEIAARLIGDSTFKGLQAGEKVGPYQIECLLGAGGMGQVYRARDVRLGRWVAIKINLQEFGERFEREARAISAINHPNICVLYDVGPDYLVMELLDGPTLAEKLNHRPLAVDLTLRYGAQIAYALGAAHAQGIVHRDLKPGNIMIVKAGAKVLDFGLAKSSEDKTSTTAHSVMGSAAYMAPEQRAGRQCDARTDIYALGLVLYEMATGRRPQPGHPLPTEQLPEGLTHTIQRCLETDPEQRWQSARDVAAELEWLASRKDTVPQKPKTRMVLGAATLLASSIAALWLAAYIQRTMPGATAISFSFSPDVQAYAWDVAVSPDGKQIAFSDSNIQKGAPALWLRALDSPEIQQLPGTEAAIRPFWAPDGRSLGFLGFNPNGVKRVDFTGGQSIVHDVVPSAGYIFGGGAWNQQGVILYQPEQTGSGLYAVPAAGGTPVAVTKINATHREIAHRYPQFLPDGRHFLYWVWSVLNEYSGVYLGSLDRDEKLPEIPLIQSWREAHYAEPGYLLYLVGSTLNARKFDAARLRFTGDATPLPERVGLQMNWTGQAMFSTSANGILVYQESVPQVASQIVVLDRAGHVTRSIDAPPVSGRPSLDPSHQNVVVYAEDENAVEDLWRINLASGVASRLTKGEGSNREPLWSHDGERILFRSNRSGVYDLYEKRADGSGEERLVLESPHTKSPTDWSSDGRFVIYDEPDPRKEFRRSLRVISFAGDRKPMGIAESGFDEHEAKLSPVVDRRGRYWIVFTARERGLEELYLRPFNPNSPAESSLEVPVPNGAGGSAFWRSDGKELFYFHNQELMAVDVRLGGDVPDVGAARKLFDLPATQDCVALDAGAHFLCVENAARSRKPKINVVVNWTAWLNKK